MRQAQLRRIAVVWLTFAECSFLSFSLRIQGCFDRSTPPRVHRIAKLDTARSLQTEAAVGGQSHYSLRRWGLTPMMGWRSPVSLQPLFLTAIARGDWYDGLVRAREAVTHCGWVLGEQPFSGVQVTLQIKISPRAEANSTRNDRKRVFHSTRLPGQSYKTSATWLRQSQPGSPCDLQTVIPIEAGASSGSGIVSPKKDRGRLR